MGLARPLAGEERTVGRGGGSSRRALPKEEAVQDFPQVWLSYKGRCEPATARCTPGPQPGVSWTATRDTSAAQAQPLPPQW